MECHICPMLLLILTLDSACANDRFFISAPNVFHVGVKEKVFVQMGEPPLSSPVTLYLENEDNGELMSEKIPITCTENEPIKTVELMISREKMSELLPFKSAHPYLLLMAESPSFSTRKSTRVLVSQHRGYIFIQTDQPIYNPTQKVMYRIFTLDHTLRPREENFQMLIINAAGNRIMKSLKTAKGGILSHSFNIPDVSEMGTWKIVAHYEGDEAHAATREFKVQKFVLPSFQVTIGMEQSYLLLNAPKLNFTISALYSYGETVKGAYHCRFGVITKGSKDGQKMKPVFIRGLELTGSVQDGKATAILQTAELNKNLQDQLEGKTLSDLEQSGAELYLAVSVTNIRSGELQEAEVSIPIISHIYTIDLSRTRSHFIPGVPLDVVVVIRLPDGSPAAGVPVEIHVLTTQEKSSQATNQQGAVFAVFNIPDAEVAVEVSVDGQQQRKVIQRASSPSDCFLYLSFTNRIYSVGESLTVTYQAVNGPPNGFIYYMVFSRGSLIKQHFLRAGTTTIDNLLITPDMVPSFRLIGYYYNQRGDIIADSVWVDVKAECEKKVEVSSKMHQFYPGKQAVLQFNLHGQKAKVALLAVDKAIYALNAHNKLTAKQVFSSMQSYDLGCSYGGGSDAASTLNDAGLSFISQSTESVMREGLGCHSHSVRQRRSLDLQQEMMILKSNFSSEKLQECCVRGFSLIPMKRTCEERANRISQVETLLETDPLCAEAFLECCRQGENLRQRLRQEDAKKGLGRTANALEIEEFFFDTTNQYIRRYFPPSFAFTTFDVNGEKSYSLSLPDSITTWEIQAISLSATHGFCVAEPYELRTFKEVFVSLRLPYSVKKYEQIAIEPVIYNYGDNPVQLAVHMEQTKGLCSPGSATSTAFVNITVDPQSSSFVSFSAVPMVTGTIPIKIRLYDIEQERGIDAIEKTLNVWTEGIVQRVEETRVVKLDGSGTKSLTIDGNLPDNTVPDSNSNIFIKMEGDGFGESSAQRLLSPEGVAALLKLPDGCGEQTMKKLAPTALALRYFDINQQWFKLPAGTRDVALQYTEEGYMRILTFKKADGSYGAWTDWPSSTWLTGLVVKVLSLLAERQAVITGRQAKVVSEEEISHSVRYLLSVQNDDGSFTDPHPVIHNEMQGGIRGKEEKASTTAFITIALYRSLLFLKVEEQNNAEASILKSTTYLLSHLEELEWPYAVAITTYCLSVCNKPNALRAWMKLERLATVGKDGCHMWGANAAEVADAITVETTAYALLAAVALEKSERAESAACWLTSQENYGGGFESTQDTIVALEALSEYELKKPPRTFTEVAAQFTVPGRTEKEDLSLENRREKVEKELKRMIGNNVNVLLTGHGEAKLKVVKAYHLLEPMDKCEQLSIKVTVEGKVKYTAKIMENYDYYGEDYSNDEAKEGRVPRSAIEWFDARTRYRRDADPSPNSENTVSYEVCVSYSLSRNLTGMAIADITLLSGFEAVTEDLDTLKLPPEQYISHYEISYGRVLIYFNKLEQDTCIAFDAIQRVPVSLLQPAPASFYDYYEPKRKCTVFYSAPQRSKMVSKLCSEDVCQCAERPCHKIKSVFEPVNGKKITLEDRSNHACFFPIADYGYIVEVVSVSVKSNFELYTTNVTEVLRAHGDMHVNVNDVRVFVKRLQCKGQLQTGKRYLILGKDGTTTDSNGKMQYLLESNTWVEQIPDERKCKRQSYRAACKGLNDFLSEYKINGCRQ